jgi:hypothetical protein
MIPFLYTSEGGESTTIGIQTATRWRGESEDGGGNVWVPFRNEEMNNPDFGTGTVYVVAQRDRSVSFFSATAPGVSRIPVARGVARSSQLPAQYYHRATFAVEHRHHDERRRWLRAVGRVCFTRTPSSGL